MPSKLMFGSARSPIEIRERTTLGRQRPSADRATTRARCDYGPATFWLHWVHCTPGVVATQQRRRVESTHP